MFTRKDFAQIDKDYFFVVTKTCYHIILRSRNTGHIWDIECRDNPNNTRSFVISHKHNEGEPFHQQPCFHPKSVTEAQGMILAHDNWHIGGRPRGQLGL